MHRSITDSEYTSILRQRSGQIHSEYAALVAMRAETSSTRTVGYILLPLRGSNIARALPAFGDSIGYEDVRFGYGGEEVLRGVSLTIRT